MSERTKDIVRATVFVLVIYGIAAAVAWFGAQ